VTELRDGLCDPTFQNFQVPIYIVIPLLASEKYFHTTLQPYLRKNIGSQPNSAVFFTYRDNSAKPNISRIFFQPSVI